LVQVVQEYPRIQVVLEEPLLLTPLLPQAEAVVVRASTVAVLTLIAAVQAAAVVPQLLHLPRIVLVRRALQVKVTLEGTLVMTARTFLAEAVAVAQVPLAEMAEMVAAEMVVLAE
jgi:hypothetical protein